MKKETQTIEFKHLFDSRQTKRAFIHGLLFFVVISSVVWTGGYASLAAYAKSRIY